MKSDNILIWISLTAIVGQIITFINFTCLFFAEGLSLQTIMAIIGALGWGFTVAILNGIMKANKFLREYK